MNTVKADLRQIDRLDIQKQGSALSPPGVPPRRVLSDVEKGALKAALNLGKIVSPQTGLLLEPIGVAESRPSITITPLSSVPVGMTPRAGTDVTLAVGLSVSAFAVIGVTGQAGLYGSTTPELGVFASVGGGWWTNVGAGVGPTITMIFGPPSDLAGVSWGIGADAAFMAGSIGALLLFSLPPFRFLGIAVSLAVGPSAIPAFDVTVQVSNTFTKPLLK